MSKLTRAYVGLGANLGDPVQQVVDARAMLYGLDGVVTGRCSSLYLTSPVGYSDQPDFINCVVQLDVVQSAHRLFVAMQGIELSLGRQRVAGQANAPRVIDLDLLVFGDQQLVAPNLVVPHPRISERLFVLLPLAELVGDEVIAGLGKPSELVDSQPFSGQTITRLVY